LIAILGGGVAGAALAWALSRRGRRDVVVFDVAERLAGSTGRALGGFRTQHGSALNIRLSLASRPYFEAKRDRIRFQANGYLYLAENEEVAVELSRRARMQRACGLPVEHPDPVSLVPFLEARDVCATNFCALDGVYLPPLVLESYVEEATGAGAQFRYGSAASASDIAVAEAVVIAAGIWSPAVGRDLGVELDVQPLERGVFQVGPFDWLGDHVPLTLEAGSGYHFRERDGRLLLMFPGDQHDWQPVREWLQRRVPRAAVERPEAHWAGFYEMSFDSHPLVGETPRDGVWASCGFSGHGVMHSPAVAESLAAMMLGETPPVDIGELSPLRRRPLSDFTQL
jgi:sarcosine oxidase subunit beta